MTGSILSYAYVKNVYPSMGGAGILKFNWLEHSSTVQKYIFPYPKIKVFLVCTSNKRAFKTMNFDTKMMESAGK